jgi:hypothetical protein
VSQTSAEVATETALARAQALVDSDPAAALSEAHAILRSAPDARALRVAAHAHRRRGELTHAEVAELAAIKVGLTIRS